ncbi:MAG: sugar phosphate isomerase/epimerase [Candidatus Hydrogenedentes bacterium]|nr:sugar phosphate isomerase/epimerase [Candidatus Hydrogenedentota bacterium]
MAAMEVGVITSLTADNDPFAHVGEFGLRTCQLCNWNPATWSAARAKAVKAMAKRAGVRIAAVWAGYSGPAVWNFIDGPSTLGLVPGRYRKKRVAELKKGADFAALAGAPAIITHVGFIPENPGDKLYAPTVDALADVAGHCKKRGIGFWFETGQETPVTLLRTIQDIGLPNLGINLDTANCILYGKANPVDSLDVFGEYVRNLHAKDGFYPTDGRALGKEAALGQGKVEWPRLFRRLKELKFTGEVVIEREISGPQQAKDIRKAVSYLRGLIARVQAG